jgi:uncharacterized protein YkwD
MRAMVRPCRRRYASFAAAAAAVLALLAPAAASAEDCPYADAHAGEAPTLVLATATVCLINEQRATYGLAPLTSRTLLATTASKYAGQMVADGRFGHVDESGGNVLDRLMQADPALRDRWEVVGENLGWGTYDLATPRAMVNGWMGSPSHRDNLLYPGYRELGIGIADGAPQPDRTDALTYAAVFATIDTVAARRPSASQCRRARRARRRSPRIAAIRRACAAPAPAAGS